jgi:hypothetical protein
MALALGVVGLINVQFAIRNDVVYVLEVNPRASRTVPFVSKAIGVPLAKVATRAMLGESVAPLAGIEETERRHVAVKESVFPFIKFPEVDTVLGPEMKSTGEVMGIDRDFRKSYLKSQIAAGSTLPASGKIFVSVRQRDKRTVASLARRLTEMGFGLVATRGTAAAILYALLVLASRRAAGDTVAFYPSDHFVSDDQSFGEHIEAAFAGARERPDLVTLLGIAADRAETGYGWIEPGDAVAAGDPVIVLESMKMEIPVEAPRAGTVREIKVAEGQTVQEGDTVAVLD